MEGRSPRAGGGGAGNAHIAANEGPCSLEQGALARALEREAPGAGILGALETPTNRPRNARSHGPLGPWRLQERGGSGATPNSACLALLWRSSPDREIKARATGSQW